MVITIEPGIYLPDMRLGIRIEDDVLLTPAGNSVLTAAIPKKPDEVQALMRG
jgi:Xaa-Pro aminopeptidase